MPSAAAAVSSAAQSESFELLRISSVDTPIRIEPNVLVAAHQRLAHLERPAVAGVDHRSAWSSGLAASSAARSSLRRSGCPTIARELALTMTVPSVSRIAAPVTLSP